MRFANQVFPFICFVMLPGALMAQDKIYLDKASIDGKILDITTSTISYQPLNNPKKTFFLPARDAKIVFNSRGDYLLPSKLDSSSPQTKTILARFLSPESTPRSKDVVFTSLRTRIEGNISKEDDQFLYLADARQINKQSISVLVYASGQSRIFSSIDSAVAVLFAVQQSEPGSAIPNPPLPQATIAGTDSPGQSNATSKEDSARQRAFSEIAGNISRKEFEDKAVQKTNKLNQYLKILCDKSADYEKSNEAIDQAVSLFVNENAMVETSSIKKNTVFHYKIREYLTRVKLFKYDRVEIEWTHVQYVSNLKLGADGNFYGVVTFEQEFRGYRDNVLVYSDITRKNANVVLKTYKKSYEGSSKTIWDVLLSDIGVVYTKSSE